MAIIHIPEEAAKNFGTLILRVQHGDEIVIEGSNASVRMVMDSRPKARTGAEILELLSKLPGERPVMDDSFADDIQFAMDRMRTPPNSSPWD
jgi:hypothetical protein